MSLMRLKIHTGLILSKKSFFTTLIHFIIPSSSKNDFTNDSKDLSVKRFRRKFDAIGQEWEKLNDYSSGVPFFLMVCLVL